MLNEDIIVKIYGYLSSYRKHITEKISRISLE